MFLLAILSIVLVVFLSANLAAILLPLSMACLARFIAVRNIDRKLELRLLRLTDWRARLRAWAVLAILLGTLYCILFLEA